MANASAPPRRTGSAERSAQRAAALVNTALVSNAERNERSLAAARLLMAIAFALRVMVLFTADLAAGKGKDWLVLTVLAVMGLLSAAHLVRPTGAISFRSRQVVFVVLDLVGFSIALFPALIWPEATFTGILQTPFAGTGVLVCVAGGLRLRKSLAIMTATMTVILFALACALDVTWNGPVVRWGIAEVAFYAIEIFSGALLGVVIASRTHALAIDSAAAAIAAARARERLGSYIGHEVAEEALRQDEIQLGGVRKPVAVLFSDLRGFTSYAEKLSPEELVIQLNAYLEEMVAVISAHGGVVDKYMGDGIMAVFGAPRTRPDDAVRALRAAKALVSALERHNARRASSSQPPLKMGIGVHFGEAVAGNIGTLDHAQYTIIGDTVNLASRLESATKDIGAPLLVSLALKEAAGDEGASLVSLGSLAVRGRGESVEVYGVAPET